MSNLENLQELASLTEEEKKLALNILEELSKNGRSDLYDDLKYEDFDEIPVDIETFLHDYRYLGRGLTEEKTGRFTLFPYWETMLKKLFPTNLTTSANTLILTGGIGLGKSLCGDLSLLYLLYRMLCLKDPYLYYGLQPIDKITFSLLNCTIDAAKGVAWDKAQQLIQSSEWFMSHGSLNRSNVAPTWQPDKRIELIFGSNNRHVIGRALFCNITDEADFGVGNNVEKLKAKTKKLISQIDARMQSRFMKGTFLPTLNIIISSKQSEQAFLESYIEMKETNDSKTTLVIDEPQWVIRNDKGSPDDPGAFYVAVGNKFLASELLPLDATEDQLDYYRRKGQQLLKIPPGYYEAFRDDIDTALTDIAGISAINSLKYISGARLNEAKIITYKNPFTKDVIEVGNSKEDKAQYSDFFDLSIISEDLKSKPLFIHLDQSISGDKTGIAGTWILSKRPHEDGIEESKEMLYRLAFSVSVKAPRGYQISFDKTRNFIRWLRAQGFRIKVVSADTYQSATILQQLQDDGFTTQILSVDRIDTQSKICLPYQFARSAIYEKYVEIYDKCDLLTEELTSLEKKGDGHIDHPVSGSKDQSDAFVGSLYTASKHTAEFAYDYGETYAVSLAVNEKEGSYEDDKQQLKIAFEEEMKRIFNPFQSTSNQEQKENNLVENKIEDKLESDFMDFGLGPAEEYKPPFIEDGIILF